MTSVKLFLFLYDPSLLKKSDFIFDFRLTSIQ